MFSSKKVHWGILASILEPQHPAFYPRIKAKECSFSNLVGKEIISVPNNCLILHRFFAASISLQLFSNYSPTSLRLLSDLTLTTLQKLEKDEVFCLRLGPFVW